MANISRLRDPSTNTWIPWVQFLPLEIRLEIISFAKIMVNKQMYREFLLRMANKDLISVDYVMTRGTIKELKDVIHEPLLVTGFVANSYSRIKRNLKLCRKDLHVASPVNFTIDIKGIYYAFYTHIDPAFDPAVETPAIVYGTHQDYNKFLVADFSSTHQIWQSKNFLGLSVDDFTKAQFNLATLWLTKMIDTKYPRRNQRFDITSFNWHQDIYKLLLEPENIFHLCAKEDMVVHSVNPKMYYDENELNNYTKMRYNRMFTIMTIINSHKYFIYNPHRQKIIPIVKCD